MVKETTKQIAADALANLSEALRSGESDTLTAYNAFMAKFYRYSWFNTLLILSQNNAASHVAGFMKWKEQGRYVKKGEKGLAILVPLKYKSKTKDYNEDADETLVGFTTGYVFDVAQTDGEPIPEFATVSGDPGLYSSRLRDLIQERKIDLRYADGLDGARGSSHGGRICILKGMPAAEEFQVLAHELAHELLHRGDRRSETNVQIRELEAEAVAFVCCTSIGIETGSASADYIKLYQGDEKLLGQSLSYIQNVSAQILDYILHPQVKAHTRLSSADQRELHEVYASNPKEGWRSCECLGFEVYERYYGCDPRFDNSRTEGEDYIVLDYEPDDSTGDSGWWTLASREKKAIL